GPSRPARAAERAHREAGPAPSLDRPSSTTAPVTPHAGRPPPRRPLASTTLAPRAGCLPLSEGDILLSAVGGCGWVTRRGATASLLVLVPGAVLRVPGLVAVGGPRIGLGRRLAGGVGTHPVERAGHLPLLDLTGARVVVPLVEVVRLGDLLDPVLGRLVDAAHESSSVRPYVDSSHACRSRPVG